MRQASNEARWPRWASGEGTATCARLAAHSAQRPSRHNRQPPDPNPIDLQYNNRPSIEMLYDLIEVRHDERCQLDRPRQPVATPQRPVHASTQGSVCARRRNPPGPTTPPRTATDGRRARTSRRLSQRQLTLLHRERRLAKALSDVIGLEIRMLSKNLLDRHAVSNHRHHGCHGRHGKPEPTNRRHPTHHVRVNRDAGESHVRMAAELQRSVNRRW